MKSSTKIWIAVVSGFALTGAYSYYKKRKNSDKTKLTDTETETVEQAESVVTPVSTAAPIKTYPIKLSSSVVSTPIVTTSANPLTVRSMIAKRNSANNL